MRTVVCVALALITGSNATDECLSKACAEAVRDILVREFDIPAS